MELIPLLIEDFFKHLFEELTHVQRANDVEKGILKAEIEMKEKRFQDQAKKI